MPDIFLSGPPGVLDPEIPPTGSVPSPVDSFLGLRLYPSPLNRGPDDRSTLPSLSRDTPRPLRRRSLGSPYRVQHALENPIPLRRRRTDSLHPRAPHTLTFPYLDQIPGEPNDTFPVPRTPLDRPPVTSLSTSPTTLHRLRRVCVNLHLGHLNSYPTHTANTSLRGPWGLENRHGPSYPTGITSVRPKSPSSNSSVSPRAKTRATSNSTKEARPSI